ncbi:MAG: carbohydrate porin [Verrucomicrobiae bacterium]
MKISIQKGLLVIGLVGTIGIGRAENQVSNWWEGKYATGNWFGARETLVDHGVAFSGEWKANFLWDVGGGLEQRFGYDDELKFRVLVDAAKLTGAEGLEGLTFFSDVRYRGGAGVNKWVGASGNFAPSTFQGGRLWRFQNAYASYTTPELFGVKELLTVSGGWQNPTDHFLTQPLNKFFLNNSFTSSRGFGANGIPWGGSYSAWGGHLKVKPVDWYYAQAGLYLAIPQGTSTDNHGLDFAGYRINPNLNGLYFLGETGVTPKIGPAKLPGRYAAGFIYWGVENTSFAGEKADQKVALYWQADQMLFREPSPEEAAPLGKGPSDGKKAVVSKPKLSDQGLSLFSLINFAPQFNNTIPFYFQTGLVYKGLIPGRDNDQIGAAIAYGSYSADKQSADEANGRPIQEYEGVLELDYRVQINKWAYVQPSLQYIIRPGAAGQTPNATVLGFQAGVTF